MQSTRREFIGAVSGAIGYMKLISAGSATAKEPTLVAVECLRYGLKFSLMFSDDSEIKVTTKSGMFQSTFKNWIGMHKREVWAHAQDWIS